MLPLSMNEATISPAAPATISQVASDVLQLIAAAARQRLQDRPNLHASAGSRHENAENNAFLRGTLRIRVCIAKTQEVKMS